MVCSLVPYYHLATPFRLLDHRHYYFINLPQMKTMYIVIFVMLFAMLSAMLSAMLY